jgi:hypothetical protein
MFLLYIDYNNYTDIFNKTSNFLKYHYCSLHQNNINKVIEKNNIRWVTIDTLINCIESKENPISLRGVFYKTIENSIDQIILLNK